MACDWTCLKRTHMSSVSTSLSHASQPQRPRRVIVAPAITGNSSG